VKKITEEYSVMKKIVQMIVLIMEYVKGASVDVNLDMKELVLII
jgi:hypothetical protein